MNSKQKYELKRMSKSKHGPFIFQIVRCVQMYIELTNPTSSEVSEIISNLSLYVASLNKEPRAFFSELMLAMNDIEDSPMFDDIVEKITREIFEEEYGKDTN